MIAFLIEVVKALVTFFAVCVGLGILYLVFVVVREVGWEVRRQNREKHEQEDKRGMKAEFFKAVCPLEIGDTVAIKVSKDGEAKEALYLPQGCTVITTAAVALHKVTDIATLHYLKKGETQFLYELDGYGKYEPLTVKVPVREFADELKRRGR